MIRFFIFLSTTTILWAHISTQQIATLQTVRDVAKTIPDYTGETYENTLAAICLTESSAGVHIVGDLNTSVLSASLGPMQIRIKTARYIARITPALHYLTKLSDNTLASLLITDLKTSTKIAAHLLVHLRKSRKKYYYMVSGYNGGWQNTPYYNRVMKNYTLVTKLIKKGLLN